MTKDEEFLSDMIGEGLHTAFRKASDHPKSAKIWKLINELPDEEWANVIDFIVHGLLMSGLQVSWKASDDSDQS